MKADIESQLLTIAATISQSNCTALERQELTKRRNFLEMVPSSKWPEIDQTAINFVYGTEDGDKFDKNINRCISFDSCSFNC